MRRPLFFDNDILPDEITSCNSEYVISTAVSSDDITTYFDTFVSNLISKEISKYKECDCIILPYSLDRDHYSGLLGIVVAIHLRLTPEWGFSRKPIIFIGPDPIEQVAKLSEYGEFLFTPWVFYSSLQTSDELDSLLCVIESKIGEKSEMPDDAYATFLKKMKVTPPAMYGTRHSIANSWCRYHWFKKVGIEDKIPEKDMMLSNFLYFKYMKQVGMYRTQQVEEEKYAIDPINNENAKILLVDDEADKWAPFFKEILNKTDDKHFVSIGGEFNKYPIKDNLIDYVVGQIEDINPDVVLLDLRLHEDDSRNDIDKKDISGNIILRKIKDEINKGIQVIAFSASNKIWNYLPLSYDGIVLKESPEQSVDNHSTPNSIIKLRENVERSLKRANSLIPIYNKLQNIRQLYRQYKCFNDDKLQEIDSNIDVAYELLDKNDLFKYNKYYAFSYLQLYIVIEKFLQEKKIYFRNELEKKAIVLDKFIVARWEQLDKNLTITDYAIKRVGNRYTLGIDKSNTDKKDFTKETNFMMSSLLLMGYGFKDLKNSPWPEINNIRNTKAGHPEKGELQEFEYMQLVDFLTFIFDKNNLKLASLDNSLPDNKEIYAIITVAKGPIQARIDEDNDKKSYPLSFKKEKPHLRLGDKIVVELIRKNNQIIGLNYVK